MKTIDERKNPRRNIRKEQGDDNRIIVKDWGTQSYYFAWRKKREKSSRHKWTKKKLFNIRKWELDSRALNISVSGSSLFSQLSAVKQLNLLQQKQEDKKKRQVKKKLPAML